MAKYELDMTSGNLLKKIIMYTMWVIAAKIKAL